MAQINQHDILVVDSDTERRMRLKAATLNANLFSDVLLIKDHRTALQRLQDGIERSIIIIANDSNVGEFIAQAKISAKGRDSAFVLIVDQSGGSSTGIAGSILNGADAILQEPFSVDALVATTLLATEVYGQRKRSREEGAIKHLVNSCSSALDRVATAKALDMPPGDAWLELKKVTNAIKSINPSYHNFYLDALTEKMETVEVPYVVAQFREKQLKEAEIKAQTASLLTGPTASKRVAQARIIKRG